MPQTTSIPHRHPRHLGKYRISHSDRPQGVGRGNRHPSLHPIPMAHALGPTRETLPRQDRLRASYKQFNICVAASFEGETRGGGQHRLVRPIPGSDNGAEFSHCKSRGESHEALDPMALVRGLSMTAGKHPTTTSIGMAQSYLLNPLKGPRLRPSLFSEPNRCLQHPAPNPLRPHLR